MSSACCRHPALLLLALTALFATSVTAASVPTAPTPAAAPSMGIGAPNVNVETEVLRFSYELERWLDTEKSPCQDFYAYVCGKTVNNTKEQFEARLQREKEKFDKFLSANNNEELLDAELKLKQFYESCKNARSVEELKESFMYKQSGGWPAIDSSATMQRRRRLKSWMDVVSAFHEAGINYFFTQRVEIKSNKRTVYLQVEDVLRYTLRKFEQLIGEVLTAYGVEMDRGRLIALEILTFERNRREILKDELKEEDVEYNYDDFKASSFGAALQIDWDKYFKSALGKPLKATDTVVVHEKTRLGKLFGFLQQTTMTRLLNWIWIDYLLDKSNAHCAELAQKYFEPVYQHIVEHAYLDKVQMAQLYSNIGRVYDELLPPTTWIDEMSQQNSHLFLGRAMHLTLNGDESLDSDYAKLQVTNRNFYRNLEKVQRFFAQSGKNQRLITRVGNAVVGDTSQVASNFMRIFSTVSTLMQQQNLTAPLNHILVGERFAEHMIASGSTSKMTGAWRSMESEREFAALGQCVARQQQQLTGTTELPYNLNELLVKLLAQQLALQTYDQWLQGNERLVRRLDSLLAAGRLQLSMAKLFYIGGVLTECGSFESISQKQLMKGYLHNSLKFRQAFRCRAVARDTCKVV
ncbi:neprilysin-4 [Ceratitis capitata]|uniref:neprilysin-4 n=1 Tax=Ceratitis capitata TaxID=7213 RepID=UPI00032A0739|nr:neprilysin-4 [Ceratitis capitata]